MEEPWSTASELGLYILCTCAPSWIVLTYLKYTVTSWINLEEMKYFKQLKWSSNQVLNQGK